MPRQKLPTAEPLTLSSERQITLDDLLARQCLQDISSHLVNFARSLDTIASGPVDRYAVYHRISRFSASLTAAAERFPFTHADCPIDQLLEEDLRELHKRFRETAFLGYTK